MVSRGTRESAFVGLVGMGFTLTDCLVTKSGVGDGTNKSD